MTLTSSCLDSLSLSSLSVSLYSLQHKQADEYDALMDNDRRGIGDRRLVIEEFRAVLERRDVGDVTIIDGSGLDDNINDETDVDTIDVEYVEMSELNSMEYCAVVFVLGSLLKFRSSSSSVRSYTAHTPKLIELDNPAAVFNLFHAVGGPLLR